MPVHKEASLDMGFEKYAAPEIFTGEHASVKHILDDGMVRLRSAETEIECEQIHLVSKPVVKTQQKSKEPAPLIQRIENGMNNDQEIAPMQ
ncbi:hypothetical protein TNIN_45291 [Trichonephila inaurata madagascariensis]|uniref:Uncharacterized protein n=1 Tax=Trichonephila inaurata madagascariensis TaxID=2747483 RepID=A0A8X6X013_9ARAC|nr:hypothetical protein TNIN_45291 [Trichonephila inaurata madagascariensis]